MGNTYQELRYALEGLEQMNQAKDNGEYQDLNAYERDVQEQGKAITKLERKLSREIKCHQCSSTFEPARGKENYHICEGCEQRYEQNKQNFKNPEYVKEHNRVLKEEANRG